MKCKKLDVIARSIATWQSPLIQCIRIIDRGDSHVGSFRKIGDLRRDGSAYDFALWKFGTCAEYDIDVSKQMRKTISALQEKIPQLNQIRQTYDVSFVLEIVPTIYANEPTPALFPSLDIIDFCHATRTEIDIDLYVEESV